MFARVSLTLQIPHKYNFCDSKGNTFLELSYRSMETKVTGWVKRKQYTGRFALHLA